MTAAAKSKRRPERGDEAAVRARILEAAFASFRRKGYAATSTLEIATRAHVSKRDVYALVGAKQEMLIACVSERARRFRAPADLPAPRHRDALARALTSLATQLLREISDPTVVAVFRLAIAEASTRQRWRESSTPSAARRVAQRCETSSPRRRPPGCSSSAPSISPISSRDCCGAP